MNVKVLTLLLIAILGVTACKKSSDIPAAIPPGSNLNIINISTGAVNLYLNGTRINSSNLNPASSSGYFVVPSGNQNYQVKNIFNSSTNAVQPLFSYPLKLDSAGYASFFIAGATADKAFKVADNLQQDTVANTAYVRFVNASPGAGSLDMHIGEDTLKFANQAFTKASDFALIASGLKTVNVYRSGVSTALISGNVLLQTAATYTLYVKELKDGTGNTVLSIGVTLNAN